MRVRVLFISFEEASEPLGFLFHVFVCSWLPRRIRIHPQRLWRSVRGRHEIMRECTLLLLKFRVNVVAV